MVDEFVFGYPTSEQVLEEIKTITSEQISDFARQMFDANKYVVVGGDFKNK